MGYEAALNKAWEALAAGGLSKREQVRFFTDMFTVDPAPRSVADSSGRTVKEFVSILVLHYLEKRLKALPEPAGRWISFKELPGGEGYYPAFRSRAIDPLARKYGSDPLALYKVLAKIPSAVKTGEGDAGIIVKAFDAVPVGVIVWGGDDEFPPEANLLFDASIASIFCTEDVAVLAGFVTRYV